MKYYTTTIVIRTQGDDEDHAYEQALEQLSSGQFTADTKAVA